MLDPLIGRVIDEKYRIEAEIGSGGMATIYRATRLRIGDAVAIKVLHSEYLREPRFAERFQREAQTAARVKQPNVVTVYDFGVSDGLIYLVMELVEGRNLRTIIKDEGPISVPIAAEIVRQVCAALSEVHRQNAVHRDIKPANIAVAPSDDGLHVKVLDFGIASLRGGTMTTFTQTGAVLGTPAYMSPEQCLGEELDGRSDIYSLGVVLFEMLCGVAPFNSPTATAVAMQHVQQAPPPLRVLNVSVSPIVETVVLRALSKRREDRQQSAKEFADELAVAVGANDGSASRGFAPEAVAPNQALTMVQAPLHRNSVTEPHRRSRELGIIIGFASAVVLAAIALGIQHVVPAQAPSHRVVTAKAKAPAGGAMAAATRVARPSYAAAPSANGAVALRPPGGAGLSVPAGETRGGIAAPQGSSGQSTDPKALYATGYSYEFAEGVAQNYATARHWYELSAAQGYAPAEARIGRFYLYGMGVPADYSQALHWFQLGAAKNDAVAENGLGVLYRYGYGVALNYATALSWFQFAAAQGNALAQDNLGDMYYRGYGVASSNPEALHWYQLSAAQGNAYAEVSLGDMYSNGEGVPRDDSTALYWYKLAAAQGNTAAQNRVAQLRLAGR